MLPPEQKLLWPLLAPARALGFTLYGGTAVALRLGHRSSVDFDFFSERPLEKKALYEAMPVLATAEILRESPDTLIVSVVPPKAKRPVKVSFFSVAIGRFGAPELTEDGILRVASLDDLMGTKLKVILDRVETKDYDDLAAMLAAGADLSRGLGVARGMFQLNPEVSLKALTYHADVPALAATSRKLLIDAARNVRAVPDVPRISKSLSEEIAA